MLPPVAVWMIFIGTLILSARVVSGQDYPSKPIRMISPGPGGGADFVTRFIAQGISGSLGQ